MSGVRIPDGSQFKTAVPQGFRRFFFLPSTHFSTHLCNFVFRTSPSFFAKFEPSVSCRGACICNPAAIPACRAAYRRRGSGPTNAARLSSMIWHAGWGSLINLVVFQLRFADSMLETIVKIYVCSGLFCLTRRVRGAKIARIF